MHGGSVLTFTRRQGLLMQSIVRDRKEYYVNQSRLEKQSKFFYIPVLRTLLTAGGVEPIESPDRPCSISVVPGGDKDGGLTEDSWTFHKKKETKNPFRFT